MLMPTQAPPLVGGRTLTAAGFEAQFFHLKKAGYTLDMLMYEKEKNYIDLYHRLCGLKHMNGFKVYFLGSTFDDDCLKYLHRLNHLEPTELYWRPGFRKIPIRYTGMPYHKLFDRLLPHTNPRGDDMFLNALANAL